MEPPLLLAGTASMPSAQNGTQQTAYGFTGEWTDDTGMSHLRARYYDPSVGTFASLDPFEGYVDVPMSLNGYAYAHGDPINNTDPSGEIIPILIGIAVGAAIGAAIDIGMQVVLDNKPIECLDWPSVAVSAILGGIGGGVGAGLAKASVQLGKRLFIEAGVDFVASTAASVLQGGNISDNLGMNLLASFGGTAGGELVGNLFSRLGRHADEVIERVSTSANIKVNNSPDIPLLPSGIVDNAPQLPEPKQPDFAQRAQNLRQQLPSRYKRGGGNVSIMDYDVEISGKPQVGTAMSVSGKRPVSGTVNSVPEGQHIYNTGVDGYSRTWDSEPKLAERISRRFGISPSQPVNPDVTGRVYWYTEKFPCKSCGGFDEATQTYLGIGGVIGQFRARFPNLDVIVLSTEPPRN